MALLSAATVLRLVDSMAILQLRRLRGWSIKKTAEHFVLHRNTIRAWIRAAEGKGRMPPETASRTSATA